MLLRRSETEIMDALWSSPEPLSSAALIEAIPQRKWKERSVFAILDGLLKKEMIYEAGFVRRGKTIARTFAPTMTYPEFIARQVSEAGEGYKPTIPTLMSAFLNTEDVAEDTLTQLETLIAQKKSELENG